MKFFYSFLILTLLSITVQAQTAVTYVSFFPPANIVHNQVNLTQNTNSFNYTELGNNVNSENYDERNGGLILGAADGAVITIDDIDVETKIENTIPFAISQFRIDNIVRVYSTGTIQSINIGNLDYCKTHANECNTIFLSANRMAWPLKGSYNSNLNFVVNVGNLTDVTSIQYLKSGKSGSSESDFVSFIPGLKSGDKMEWRNLRIKGSKICRKYLALNPPAITQLSTSDGCRVPPDQASPNGPAVD